MNENAVISTNKAESQSACPTSDVTFCNDAMMNIRSIWTLHHAVPFLNHGVGKLCQYVFFSHIFAQNVESYCNRTAHVGGIVKKAPPNFLSHWKSYVLLVWILIGVIISFLRWRCIRSWWVVDLDWCYHIVYG